jgi:hypothetical protein
MKYVGEDKVCKKLILGYFGEKTTVNCGIYLTVSLTKVRKDEIFLKKLLPY